MSYEKQNFQDGQTLYGRQLNHIEEALTDVMDTADDLSGDVGNLKVTVDSLLRSRTIENFLNVQQIVRSGKASSVFAVGDQLHTNWTWSSTTYDFIWNIVHIPTAGVKDPLGETVPGIFLQAKYAVPVEIVFDAPEALFYLPDGLSAGDYYFTNSAAAGKVEAGSHQFTLTKAVPKGGLLCLPTAWPDNTSIASVSSYTANDGTLIETVTVSTGSTGKDLGDISTGSLTEGNINNINASGYGYNRYSESAYRQWLNSAAPAGSWWKPANKYDMKPSNADTVPGFLSGFEADFLDVILPVQQSTALNTTLSTALSKTTEILSDRFFLPSCYQMNCNVSAGMEEEAWDYWKQALGSSTPVGSGSSNVFDAYKIGDLASPTTPRTLRLRSPYRSTVNTTSYVYASGYVNYSSHARTALRSLPACVIR